MALANFLDKISLSISQRIKSLDRTGLENHLLSHCIGISIGSNAVESSEGRIGLDLTVRLIARLYPNVRFNDYAANEESRSLVKMLKHIAVEINPEINLSGGLRPTFNLVVGSIPGYKTDVPTIYVGSENWEATFSKNFSKTCGNSNNPFGIGAAICFATANLFRFVFGEMLGQSKLDDDFSFSVFNETLNEEKEINPIIESSNPFVFTLIGCGAIGNAALWSFLQLKDLNGTINLVDDQEVALSNLQRYILMLQDHVKRSKVGVTEELFQLQSKITIKPYPYKWQKMVSRLSKGDLRLLATAIDTTKERREIQSVLPQKVINAWTSAQGLGISRHFNFADDLCLCCLYMPATQEKSDSIKIAEAIGIPQFEQQIRHYLVNELLIDDHLINLIVSNTSIDPALLLSFKGQRVEIFYSEAVCGGRIITVNDSELRPQDLEVPLAHESVLAGILLAAELVIELLQLRPTKIEALTKIDLTQPLHTYIREEEHKHYSGRCICQDEVFVKRYLEKWIGEEAIKAFLTGRAK